MMRPNLSNFKYGTFISVYLINFFLSFHYYLTAYINSTTLEKYGFNENRISYFYITSAAITLLGALLFTRFLRKFGNVKVTLGLVILDLISLFLVATSENINISISAMAIHLTLVPLEALGLDIFLESITKNESNTGQLRALFLTIANTAVIIAPTIVSYILGNNTESTVYFLSSLFLLPVIIILIFGFRGFSDPIYKNFEFKNAIKEIYRDKNLRLVFIASFILSSFYAIMVIYAPLLFIHDLNISEKTYMSILSLAMFAFLIIELPAGVLADKVLGETEMMSAGFLIMGASLATLSFMKFAPIILIAVIFFATRIGAALVEVTTESYFFKKTSGEDAEIMEVFRGARHISYITTPILMILLTALLNKIQIDSIYTFFILGIAIMLIGSFIPKQVEDTL